MRIAILSPRSGIAWRGVETVSYELCKRLSGSVVFSLKETDWTKGVWGFKRTSKWYKSYALTVKKLKLAFLNYFVPWFNIFGEWELEELTYIFGLLQPLNLFKPDVIINLAGPLVGTFCRLFRAINNTPFISVGEAGIGTTEIKNAKTRPNVYIAVTPQNAENITLHMPDLCVRVIPNGVNPSAFSPDGKRFSFEELRFRAHIKRPEIEHPLILSTSALEKGKRLDLLIKAVRKLDQGSLIFAGDGPLREELLHLGRRSLGRRFIYIGTLPYDEMPILYRSCDVFSLPSLNEPFGNVLIEAMASGLPVITHDDKNRRWILGEHGGMLTDVMNVEKYADSLIKAYEAGFDKRALKHVKQFSWDYVTKNYERLIDEVCGGKYLRKN